MKCPKCGKELVRSQQNPEFGLCYDCKLKFKWVEKKFCKNCGAPLKGSFCPKCGTPANGHTETPDMYDDDRTVVLSASTPTPKADPKPETLPVYTPEPARMPEPAPVPTPKRVFNTTPVGPEGEESYFDGTMLQLVGWTLLGALITAVTCGICYPWACCMIYSWETEHTVINGRRLKFTGTATGLFGQWIKWWFLTLITCGIYGLWVGIRLKAWITKHTVFAD